MKLHLGGWSPKEVGGTFTVLEISIFEHFQKLSQRQATIMTVCKCFLCMLDFKQSSNLMINPFCVVNICHGSSVLLAMQKCWIIESFKE